MTGDPSLYERNYRPQQVYPTLMALPVGCICPPGANKECENPSCPRKPFNTPDAIGATK